jgi:hypothetical protein
MSWEAPFSRHAAGAIRAGKQRWDRETVYAGTVTRGRSGYGENRALGCDSPFEVGVRQKCIASMKKKPESGGSGAIVSDVTQATFHLG